MVAEIDIKLKCEECHKYSEIDEYFNDYFCESCRLKNTNIEILMAIKESFSRCIITDEEIKKTENGMDGWIWIGEHTEREKELFIRGAKFGGECVLFKICDELNLIREWEKIHEEFLRIKK